MSSRPLIGITPDIGETAPRQGRPALSRYELKQSYVDAVIAAGGTPLVLPFVEDDDAVAQLLSLCQGLVISGGAFDVPPEFYGATPHPRLGPMHPERSRFERRILRKALERGVPVLGICGGMQLLAVELGGKLVQDLPSERPGPIAHQQADDPREPSHEVSVLPGTLLSALVGEGPMTVNSTHHQAVRDPGRARVAARAGDDLIEAIELPPSEAKFVLGVQWHPELVAAKAHARVYGGLVEAARNP